MVGDDVAAAARALVAQGALASSALVRAGAPRDAVLRAVSVASGQPAAPPRSTWDPAARATASVADATWLSLVAVPIPAPSGRLQESYADPAVSISSAALALPAHEALVALEDDVRAALATAAPKTKGAVSFLAPPSALTKSAPKGAPSPSARRRRWR